MPKHFTRHAVLSARRSRATATAKRFAVRPATNWAAGILSFLPLPISLVRPSVGLASLWLARPADRQSTSFREALTNSVCGAPQNSGSASVSRTTERHAAGQGILIDFGLALLVFLAVWFYLNGQFDSKLVEAARTNSFEVMKLKGEYALDSLVKSNGKPSDWEKKDFNSIVYPGLARNDRELSQAKLSAFSSFSSNYAQLKDKMGLEGNDFFFSFDGVDDFNAGIQPDANSSVVVARRTVAYKGGIGVASLKVYTRKN